MAFSTTPKVIPRNEVAPATGAISSIENSNLTTSRALASDPSGKIVTSGVTASEQDVLKGGLGSSNVTPADSNQFILNHAGVMKQTTFAYLWNWIVSKLSGAASTILTTNLTTNRVLIGNGSGKVAVSSRTTTELDTLANATGNLQTRLATLESASSSSPIKYSTKLTKAPSSTAINLNTYIVGGFTILVRYNNLFIQYVVTHSSGLDFTLRSSWTTHLNSNLNSSGAQTYSSGSSLNFNGFFTNSDSYTGNIVLQSNSGSEFVRLQFTNDQIDTSNRWFTLTVS